MATHAWMSSKTFGTRAWARRTRGRRASDRRLRLETILAAGGIVAWAWCGYEVIRIFVR
jgi:hypothetical protein